MATASPSRPITVALVDDYDVVLIGLAHMFDHYREPVVVAEIDTNVPLVDAVDVALYDTFAQPEADHDEIGVLIASPRARAAVYTWNFHPELIDSAIAQGASGYLSKTLGGTRWWRRSSRSTTARSWSAPTPASRVSMSVWNGRASRRG